MNRSTTEALAIAVAARVPVLLWGGPGVGKTSAIRQLAEGSNLHCETVIASIREPSDFAGLPVVDPDGSVRFAPPSWARRLVEHGGGLLFLDEISTAPPAVQAALLRVILENTVGDLRLPDQVAIVAAANPPEEAADGWDLAAPLANRFCHLDWGVDVDVWIDGSVSAFRADPLPVLHGLDGHVQRSTSVVAAFISHRRQLLYKAPTDSGSAGRAWPSPRSWTMAARLLAAAASASASDEVAAKLLGGAVGPGVALEFLGWQRELDLPDPETALLNPATFEVPERGDRAYAALMGLASAVMADNTVERWTAAWRAIAHGTSSRHPDLAVPVIRMLIKHRPDGASPPPEVLSSMAPVLRAAGMFDHPNGRR